MAKYGEVNSLAMTKKRIQELDLPLMNPNNIKNDLTAFTVSQKQKRSNYWNICC